MPLQLSLATKSDIPHLVPIQYAAFHPTNRVHRLIYPSPVPVPSSIISSTITRHLSSWSSDAAHITWVKITDTDASTILPSGEKAPRVIAAAKWSIWGPGEGPTWPGPGEVIVDWIPSHTNTNTNINIHTNTKNASQNGAADDKSYIQYVLETWYSIRRQRIQGSGVLLEICFTDPEYQKRGAGKMLVDWGTWRADELGVRAFVEASPEGKRLYESCGFKVLEDVQLRGDDLEKEGRREWAAYGVADWIFMERPVGEREG